MTLEKLIDPRGDVFRQTTCYLHRDTSEPKLFVATEMGWLMCTPEFSLSWGQFGPLTRNIT